MEITWNGHSCFTVKTQEGSVVLDPYEDGKVPGLGPLRLEADAVLCSHEHGDHNFRAGVSLTGRPFSARVEAIPSWHDEVCGRKRGANTIHVLYAEGMKLVHLGDLGTELNREQIETLAAPDVLLIPIGGFYTIDAAQALQIVEQLHPRITVPMHFRRGSMGFDVIATPDEFLAHCPNVVEYAGNTLTVDPDTPAQTAVLYL
jgi:L-ascorbate metabolism protein UlaG (beta-lactamase superfamily)